MSVLRNAFSWQALNPLTNEISTSHHLNQCIILSEDDHSDSSDIVNFLVDNFERHCNTMRAPFQINLHVQWVIYANRLKALAKFIDHVSKAYPWFGNLLGSDKNLQTVLELVH